jgi:integrase/recombinase XerD
MSTSRLLPFQPFSMTAAPLAAVSFLARYAGHTHELYANQLRRWFEWCEGNGLDPLVGLRAAAEGGLREVPDPRPGPARADPLPPGRPTITVHHGALAYLLGINALTASEAAAVRIEDYGETLCGRWRPGRAGP